MAALLSRLVAAQRAEPEAKAIPLCYLGRVQGAFGSPDAR